MRRRWLVPVAALAMLGTMSAAVSAASASPGSVRASAARSAWPAGFRPGGHMIQVGGPLRTTVDSTNWSGYAVKGANGAYKSVSATWTEPKATCTSSQSLYASFWVGLDGYNSNSVEQTGTDSDCNGTTPSYYGWYEMYPAYPVNFSNPVAPGDKFSASVTFSGTDTYTLVLTNITASWTKTIVKNQSGLDRSSAEVITEAPSSNSGVLPLADFGTVKYSSSTVNGTSLGTQSPIKIIMDDKAGNDKDSTSAIASSGKFHNTWIRST
jgi:hypothetical protein